jgi:hypothetical protein
MSSFKSSFSFLNQCYSDVSSVSVWPDSFITTSPSLKSDGGGKASDNIDKSNKQEEHDANSDHDVEFVRRGLRTMYKYI